MFFCSNCSSRDLFDVIDQFHLYFQIHFLWWCLKIIKSTQKGCSREAKMSLWVGREGKIPPGDYRSISLQFWSHQVKKAKLGSHGRNDKEDKEIPFLSPLQQGHHGQNQDNHNLSLPFLAAKRVIDYEESESDKPNSIDEIKDKLTKDSYVTTCEILNDMNELFDWLLWLQEHPRC